MPKLAVPAGRWQAPPSEYVATGQLQATEFPTFEQLNMGYDRKYKLGRPAPHINKNYQQRGENSLADE
jgi:hypothetical protein